MSDRLVALGLAGDAGADARQRLAPLLRDRLAAIVAFLGALALRRQRTRAKDRVLHRVVDLVLNRAIARPSASHVQLLREKNARTGLGLRGRWRSIGLESTTGDGAHDGAFPAIAAHGGDSEHPIVDTHALDDEGAVALRIAQGSWLRADQLHAHRAIGLAPLIGVGPSPARYEHRVSALFPAEGRVGADGTFGRYALRRWRSTRKRGQGSDVQLCDLFQIWEVHLVDGVAVADAILRPQVLMLVVVILDSNRETHGRETYIQELGMVAAATETVVAPDLHHIQA